MARKIHKGKGKQATSLTVYKNIILLVLLAIPFIKGANIENYFYLLGIILGVLVLVNILHTTYYFDVFDWLFIGLCLAYALSIMGAESPRTAMVAAVWQVCYFLCFFLARKIFIEPQDQLKIILVFLTSLILISFLAIISKLGFPTPGNMVIAGRLAGTFEYTNTFAALLVTGIVMLYVLVFEKDDLKENRRWLISGYIGIILLTVALFLTFSRGGLLIYGVMFLILFAVSGSKLRLGVTYWSIPICAYVMAIVYSGFGATQHTFMRVFELADAGFSSSYRFIFYNDAFKIFKDNWLQGTGAGGWEYLYPLYQPFQYHTKFIHSSLMQPLVDIGLIGTLLLAGLILLSLYQNIIKWRNNLLSVEGKALTLGMAAFFAHSLIDFDLSIPVAAVYFFILLGLNCSGSGNGTIKAKIPISVISGLLILTCVVFGLGDYHAVAADKLVIAGNYNPQHLITKLQNSLKFDPLNTRIINSLGEHQASWGKKNNEPQLIQDSLDLFDTAIRLEPNNYKGYLAKGKVLSNNGYYDAAIEQYEKIIELMPYKNTGYEFLLRTCVDAAIQSADVSWAEKALAVYTQAINQDNNIKNDYKKYVLKENLLAESLMLNFHAGVADIILKDYAEAIEKHTKVRDLAAESLRNEINVWIYISRRNLGMDVSSVSFDAEILSGAEEILDRFN